MPLLWTGIRQVGTSAISRIFWGSHARKEGQARQGRQGTLRCEKGVAGFHVSIICQQRYGCFDIRNDSNG